MTLSQFRRQRLTQAASDAGVDLIVASLPANVQYLTGYYCINLDVLQRTESYALFHPTNGSVSIVGSTAELPSIVEVMGADADLYCYGSFRFDSVPNHPLSQLIEKVKQNRHFNSMAEALTAAIRGSGAKKVAFDEGRCSIPTWNAIISSCPETEFFPGSSLFMEARLVKHEEEIAGLERSTEIAEAALAAALKHFKAGMTEMDLERAYREELARQNAKPLFFVATVAHRAAYSDTKNTELAAEPGDMIRFDFGCVWNGFNSDLARTAVIGQPDEKLSVYYEAARLGTRVAIDAIRPGVTAEEIYEVAMKVTRENGIPHYQRLHCGHGIGIECYDRPSIAPGDKTILVPGMVINIETPYYELGWGGVQMESTVVVTEDGYRYLDKSSDALILLEE